MSDLITAGIQSGDEITEGLTRSGTQNVPAAVPVYDKQVIIVPTVPPFYTIPMGGEEGIGVELRVQGKGSITISATNPPLFHLFNTATGQLVPLYVPNAIYFDAAPDNDVEAWMAFDTTMIALPGEYTGVFTIHATTSDGQNRIFIREVNITVTAIP